MSSHSTVSIDGTGVIAPVYVLHVSLVDALRGLGHWYRLQGHCGTSRGDILY